MINEIFLSSNQRALFVNKANWVVLYYEGWLKFKKEKADIHHVILLDLQIKGNWANQPEKNRHVSTRKWMN